MREALEMALDALIQKYSDELYDHIGPDVASNFEADIFAVKAALAAPVQDELAYREAVSLATWLFKKHFAHEEHYASGRVVWGPCDTTAGVISQIDNMIAGLEYDTHAAPVQEFECPRCGHCCGQREWVGLTDEEVYEMADDGVFLGNVKEITRAIEAKLKEKNHD
jgi:hypothetical protein